MIKLQRDLVEQIYDILRERIINLKMKPGVRVNIQALTEEFEVSPTPIKDTLKKLSQRGLITNRAGTGYYVVNPSPNKVSEIYDLRKLFESYALETAIQSTSTKKLGEFKKEMEKLRKEIDEDKKHIECYRIDQALHSEIMINSNNQMLRDFYNQIYDFVKISQHFYRTTEEILEEHIAIVKAMLEKNLTKAKKVLEDHIDHAKNRTIKAMEKKDSVWEEGSVVVSEKEKSQ